MNMRVLMASLLALAIAAPAANALSIVNSETKDVTVKVTPTGGKEADVAIKAGATADVDCSKGCELMLGKEKLKVEAKAVTVTVKGGKFVM
jgi:uncharacterized protein YraI